MTHWPTLQISEDHRPHMDLPCQISQTLFCTLEENFAMRLFNCLKYQFIILVETGDSYTVTDIL